MILVDTSIWIDHFRGRLRGELSRRLEAGDVLVHPWVVGELALGWLGRDQAAVVNDLRILPAAPLLLDDEVLELIRVRRLAGSGLGWVDAALLGSTLVARARLWTGDRSLGRAAARAGVGM